MKTLPLFFLVFLPSFLWAQTVDSIKISQQVDSLKQNAIIMISQRKFEEALFIIEKAKKLALKKIGKDHPFYADCLFQEGRIHYNTNQVEDAERVYLEVKSIREKALGKDHLDYAAVLRNLGLLYFRMGRYEEADSLYLIVKDIRADKLGIDHLDYAAILSDLGILYLRMERFDEAEKCHLEAKAIRANKLGENSAEYIGTLNNLGSVCYFSDRYEEAEEYFLKVKNWRKENLGTDHIEYVHILSNMANLYSDMGRFEETILFYEEILKLQEKSPGKESEDYGWTLSYLGLMCKDLGRYEEAEKYLLDGTKTLGDVFGNDHFEYASALERLATFYHERGLFDAAVPLYEEVKDIREKVYGDTHSDYGNALINLANLYADMKKDEEAEPLYLQAKGIFGNIGKENPEYVWTLNNLTILYKNQCHYALAENLLKEALSITENILGKSHQFYSLNIGILIELYLEMHQYEKVEPYLLEANELEKNKIVKYAQELSENQLSSYTNKFNSFLDNFYSLVKLGQIKNSYLPSILFDNVLFYKGFLLEASCMVKNFAFRDTSTYRQYKLLNNHRDIIAREQSKIPKFRNIDIDVLKKKANALEIQLVKTVVANYCEIICPISFIDVQKQLDSHSAIIEFVHYRVTVPIETDSVIYGALILKSEYEQPKFIQLFEEKQLDSLMKTKGGYKAQYVNSLYTIAERGAMPLGLPKKSLYELIWRPLEKELANVKSIYYSPSGLLHRLNLGAIPINEEESLIDRFKLVELGSTRQIVNPLEVKNITNDAIIFGGVQYDMDSTAIISANHEFNTESLASRGELSFTYADSNLRGGTWNYLKWTEKEVSVLESVLAAGNYQTTLHKGYTATEESFKSIGTGKPSPRILHIATHGFFFPDPISVHSPQSAVGSQESVFKMSDQPMIRSGLILAGGNYAWQTGKPLKPNMDDGILTAYEISQMNLSSTELVVLSACETGLGDIQGNEGVYGLQRAFKIAGAKYLVMSLWQVPDQETSVFMTTFYRHFIEEKMTIPDAFRTTQQEMRERFINPYQWAGFVLVE